MSKFREVLARRRNEVQTQWQLFLTVFDTEVVKPGMSPEHVDTLRTVMWSAWRACAYTNGIITEPKPAPANKESSHGNPQTRNVR
ncbi:MAG: hypothetical protein EPN70_03455 [Paraburkholderia sp.]|uniref:hypothetical protein n=1 Tax=Paraburkholderia sp. TaxID=1926495 RepID=UPI00121ADE54|nr:hypothetical protein [Paraburkholderia sp.]TAM07241.1 MAG: hypothetical protein EPN70_03455 [Paraburkholderia sp.]TAM32620.1 MAG: hypothetical protein EPN59_01605 [Paraburkholderia sp.]